jgi:hypothetical protein
MYEIPFQPRPLHRTLLAIFWTLDPIGRQRNDDEEARTGQVGKELGGYGGGLIRPDDFAGPVIDPSTQSVPRKGLAVQWRRH